MRAKIDVAADLRQTTKKKEQSGIQYQQVKSQQKLGVQGLIRNETASWKIGWRTLFYGELVESILSLTRLNISLGQACCVVSFEMLQRLADSLLPTLRVRFDLGASGGHVKLLQAGKCNYVRAVKERRMSIN
jgi:hypothetical protein